MSVTFSDIRAAMAPIADQLIRTPCLMSPALSDLSGAKVYLKLENLQVSGAFKARGALIKLLSLSEDERRRGVIAMSAGNHAQGIALHAGRLGIPATIVMPKTTPFTKVARTQAYGANVVLHGGNLAAAKAHALILAQAQSLTFIHPFDDPAIIAGQGTIAIEMLQDVPDLEALLIPVGGGGLAAGMAVAAKEMAPKIDIFGVQIATFPGLARALSGAPIPEGEQTIAEGIAVKSPGKLTLELLRPRLADVLLVTDQATERAIHLLVDEQRVVAEGAGAVPLAALLDNKKRFAGRKVGLVISGGNLDARLLASIMMRGLARSGRLVRLRVEINDAPGVLSQVAGIIGANEGNIVEIAHQRLFQDVPVKHAEVDVLVETINRAALDRIVEALGREGFPTRALAATADGE